MSALDALIVRPRLAEIDEIVLALPIDRVWEIVRHRPIGDTPFIRALFALRTLPSRLSGGPREEGAVLLDRLESSEEKPGFQILVDRPPHEVAVGAIGKVWHLDIPFVHVRGAQAFADFSQAGYVKVAWSLALAEEGDAATRLRVEVRVTATDDDSWSHFERYFALIGPASRFIRKSLLSGLVREFGTPESRVDELSLVGDELLEAEAHQVTQSVVIAAPPELIWPWLVQMGCGRAGFYSWDVLDNDNRRSAREVHPELQGVRIGDVLPATPDGIDGFEVLQMNAPSSFVIGGLYDAELEKQLPFDAPRPPEYWQVTWSFNLLPLDAGRTRLVVRARVSSFPEGRVHLTSMRWIHRFMEAKQLENIRARVEHELPVDDFRDVIEGISGAGVVAAAALTPFMRRARSHWGIGASDAARPWPGDELVTAPLWSWTHGVEIDAPAASVWPWVAQVGAKKGGFYSYQWLENLAGCGIRNAEVVHGEWQVSVGDELSLHPRMPAPRVVEVERGKYFVAFAPPDARARAEGRPFATMSWLFLVEPISPSKCRVISRYRAACSDDVVTRLSFGPALLEPIGFAMDRRMLLGIKERAEAQVPKLRRF